MVSWENSPKKEGTCPKREWTLIDYKSHIYTTKFTDERLQKVRHSTKFIGILQKTPKFRHKLQSLPIPYKGLQNSDLDYGVYRLQKTTKFGLKLQSLLIPLLLLLTFLYQSPCWPKVIQSQPASSIPLKADI